MLDQKAVKDAVESIFTNLLQDVAKSGTSGDPKTGEAKTTAKSTDAPAPVIDYDRIILGVTSNMAVMLKMLIPIINPAKEETKPADKEETKPAATEKKLAEAEPPEVVAAKAAIEVLKTLGVTAEANGKDIIIKSASPKSSVSDTESKDDNKFDGTDPEYLEFQKYHKAKSLNSALEALSPDDKRTALNLYVRQLL